MIKKITIEKLYLLLIILIMGAWGAYNMLLGEHGSMLTGDQPVMKLLMGAMFMLTLGYLVLNAKYVHLNRIGGILLFLSCYMAVARVAVLPFTAGLFSYIYQPMNDLIFVMLFLLTSTLSCKSDKLRDFFASWIIVAMLIIALFFFRNWAFLNSGNDEAHMGTAYWPMFLLPLLFCTSRRWLRYAGTILVAAILFASFKRGGIIAIGLGLVSYLFVKEVLLGRNFTKLIGFLVAVFVLIIAFLVVDNALDNIFTERFLSIREDGGSNRDQVWATTWQMIINSDFENLVFGHGYNTVRRDSPLTLSAHNDFLESLYDYGICGFVIYLLLHFALIRQVFRGVRMRNPDTPVMACAYAIFFVLSCISHVLIYPWMAFLPLAWGMLSANERKLFLSQ